MALNLLAGLLIFLSSPLVMADTDKAPINDMVEYRKHCKVLVNLAKAYGTLQPKTSLNAIKQQRLIGAEKYQGVLFTRQEERIDEKGNLLDDRGRVIEEEDDDDDDNDDDPGSPDYAFDQLTSRPKQVASLTKIERQQLKEMAENCRDLIGVIDQYQFDVVRLKGQWNIFVRSSKAEMANLRRAFLARMKEYQSMVEKSNPS